MRHHNIFTLLCVALWVGAIQGASRPGDSSAARPWRSTLLTNIAKNTAGLLTSQALGLPCMQALLAVLQNPPTLSLAPTPS
jgi:hypothetical protein